MGELGSIGNRLKRVTFSTPREFVVQKQLLML